MSPIVARTARRLHGRDLLTLLRARYLFLAGAMCALAFGSSVDVQAQEQVDVAMPREIVIDGGMFSAGPAPAREVFPLTFFNTRLAAGKALRISLRLDSPAPSGVRIAFAGSNPRGGICASGHLSPAIFVQVFQSAPGAGDGGCDLRWSVESAGERLPAGHRMISLRWQLEAVAVDPRAALAASSLPPGQGTRGGAQVTVKTGPGGPSLARGRSAPWPAPAPRAPR